MSCIEVGWRLEARGGCNQASAVFQRLFCYVGD